MAAGAFEDAERLLRTAAASESVLVRARTERLAARIALARAFDDREALHRLLDAARGLLPLHRRLGPTHGRLGSGPGADLGRQRAGDRLVLAQRPDQRRAALLEAPALQRPDARPERVARRLGVL